MALHCVAGLGRAPLLVAIALIEGGMTPLKSIEYIRRRRQGAFNSKQLRWLLKYKKTTDEGCTIL
jgi:protein tyrosine phosphatase type 4A